LVGIGIEKIVPLIIQGLRRCCQDGQEWLYKILSCVW